MGYYKYVAEAYKGIRQKIKDPKNQDLRDLVTERKKAWRKSPTVERVERPTRIDAARKYGYKAKQGFVVARVRVRKGGLRKSRHVRGRKPKRAGVRKITPRISIQRIGEERAQKRFPNLEILGSYWLWEDGQYKWYEVVFADPSHPAIQNDRDVGWISAKQHARRVYRGLTPAGKKGRGLRKKGKGAEKIRPSLAANENKAK
ncbi:MAG: 50S ribosomal protein L15e [Candidatus Altiarchaeota archaeon]|nr:50S ribosomal protein L15e [Candidatus Altiarchaeota archaeon]